MDASVLPEMMIEGERPPDSTRVHQREGDRIAQRPVLVRVASQDVSGFLLFRCEDGDNRQPAGQKPLTGDRAPELPDEQRLRLGLE